MTSTTRRSPVFPPELDAAAARVEARILEVVEREAAHWRAVDPALDEPLDALRRFITAGGKRLRPAFVHCAFVGAGGDPADPAPVDTGAAVELVHTFALVHDDVMDGSVLRRGRPAVHREYADRHRAAGWRGEARRFGDGLAILVGDFAFVYADRLMRGAPEPALDVFDLLRLELCVGQSLDLIGSARADVDADSVRRIATYKSAKYTVERPLHLGAALAGRLPALADPLSAIGLPLGEAFQLRDDVLGAFGDEQVTGKPVGDDLREGKATPLVAAAAAAVTDAADRALLGRLGAPDLAPREITALRELFVRTGALAEIERRIERLVARAHGAISDAPLVAEARTLLAALADYVAWRDH
jgi:geranylgeranyl diphosphate synthase type I